MDQSLLKELAQFKVLLKRTNGLSADISRLISDLAYGREILAAAEESDNDQLVLLAIELKDKLGMLPQPKPGVAAVQAAAVEGAGEDDGQEKKYIRGVRG